MKAIPVQFAGTLAAMRSALRLLAFVAGLSLLSGSFVQSARAQGAQQAWVQRYQGPTDADDQAVAMALDPSGNILVTGYAFNGAQYDIVTVKYAPDGTQIWDRKYNGPANYNDFATALAVDNAGNAWVCGYSWNGANYDIVFLKYDPSGNVIFSKLYDGPAHGDDKPGAMTLDSSGNMFLTGWSYNASNNSTGPDYLTLKVGPDGKVLWAARYSEPDIKQAYGYGISVDLSGNVYVTGEAYKTAGGSDYATVKYDANGNQVWARRYSFGEANRAIAVAADAGGNVYVTGSSMDGEIATGGMYKYATIKYDTAGNQAWVQRYVGLGGQDDAPTSMALDSSGNIYVTGYSNVGGIEYDYATIKYDSSGNQLWLKTYDGPGNAFNAPTKVVVDSLGNVYVTGMSDNGANYDYATVKYDAAGNQKWVMTYDGPLADNDQSYSLAVDSSGNVYVTGTSLNDASGANAIATIQYTKANQAPVANAGQGQTVTAIHSGHTPTDFATVTLDGSGSSDPDGDSLTYAWDDGLGDTSSAVKPQFTLSPGQYNFTLTVTDPGGLTDTATVTITVNNAPNRAPVANPASNSPVTVPHDGNPVTNLATIQLDATGSTDPDGDDLHFRWKEGTNTIGSTAIISVTKPAGDYTFTLIAIDTYGTPNFKDIQVHVSPETNGAPTLTVPATAGVNIGCPVTVQSTATDPDGDAITYSKTAGPTWATVSASGAVTLNPPSGTVGTFTVAVKATDPYGAFDQKNIAVTVCPIIIDGVKLTKKSGATTVSFNVTNTDGVTVSTVSLNSSTLKGIATSNSMPVTLTQLKKGASRSVSLKFNGVASGPAQFIVNGTSSAGPVNANMTVNVP